jgi:hypothetical protein
VFDVQKVSQAVPDSIKENVFHGNFQWKKVRGEAKITPLQAYCISLACDTALWTRITFTRVLFQLRVLFCL